MMLARTRTGRTVVLDPSRRFLSQNTLRPDIETSTPTVPHLGLAKAIGLLYLYIVGLMVIETDKLRVRVYRRVGSGDQ